MYLDLNFGHVAVNDLHSCPIQNADCCHSAPHTTPGEPHRDRSVVPLLLLPIHVYRLGFKPGTLLLSILSTPAHLSSGGVAHGSSRNIGAQVTGPFRSINLTKDLLIMGMERNSILVCQLSTRREPVRMVSIQSDTMLS